MECGGETFVYFWREHWKGGDTSFADLIFSLFRKVTEDKYTFSQKVTPMHCQAVMTHPRPQTCLTQKSVPKHVVSYKRCMKPSRTRLWGWSNLLWEVFPRYSQKCQSKAHFRERASKIDNFSMKIKSSA